jgi:H+-translocating NAD(P) transhydrogenase subunit alpha
VAGTAPFHSSQVYARTLTSFLQNLVKDGKVRPAESDDIIRETLLTQGGEVVNARVRESLGLPALVAQ